MKSTLLVPILLSFAALLVGVASAQPPGGGGGRGGRQGPPPEAFAACDAQEDGTLCEFTSRQGTIEGTCRMPRGDRLVCVPNDHPPPRDDER